MAEYSLSTTDAWIFLYKVYTIETGSWLSVKTFIINELSPPEDNPLYLNIFSFCIISIILTLYITSQIGLWKQLLSILGLHYQDGSVLHVRLKKLAFLKNFLPSPAPPTNFWLVITNQNSKHLSPITLSNLHCMRKAFSVEKNKKPTKANVFRAIWNKKHSPYEGISHHFQAINVESTWILSTWENIWLCAHVFVLGLLQFDKQVAKINNVFCSDVLLRKHPNKSLSDML